MIDISGLDKAELLAALYNASEPLGMGILQARPGDMTIDEARELIGHGDDHARHYPDIVRPSMYFDYVYGRPLKVDLSGDTMSQSLYDRDHGQGAAERIITALRARTKP